MSLLSGLRMVFQYDARRRPRPWGLCYTRAEASCGALMASLVHDVYYWALYDMHVDL
jgi:hypothetical protein